METEYCPRCQMRVLPSPSNECPGCRTPIDAKAGPFSVARPSEQATRWSPRAEGNALLVTDGVTLPPRCVRTNGQISAQDDMVQSDLFFCSPFVYTLALLGVLPVIVGYFIFRRKCTVTYGLRWDLRKRYEKQKSIKQLMPMLLFCGLLPAALAGSLVILLLATLLFAMSVIVALRSDSPLGVIKVRDNAFWLRGCGAEFLRSFDSGSS